MDLERYNAWELLSHETMGRYSQNDSSKIPKFSFMSHLVALKLSGQLKFGKGLKMDQEDKLIKLPLEDHSNGLRIPFKRH